MDNPASRSFSFLLLSETVRLFEEKYSKHIDKNAIVKKKMESFGMKPGFTITAQILRDDFDLHDIDEIRAISNFLIQKFAPIVFNSPKLEGRHKISRNSSKLILSLKIYQYSLSPFFQVLINGKPIKKDSVSSRKESLSPHNFPTSTSSPELNKSITRRKSNTVIQSKADVLSQQEIEKLNFWQNSIAAFFGGAFEGSLIHFGYNTELNEIKVDKETITYTYSIIHMERPYELPSQFL